MGTMKLYILISVAVVYFAVASMGNPTWPDVEFKVNGQERQADCAGQGQDCKSMTCCSGAKFCMEACEGQETGPSSCSKKPGEPKYVSQENLGSKIAPKLVCAKSSKVNIGKHQNPENIGLKKKMKSVMHQLQKKNN